MMTHRNEKRKITSKILVDQSFPFARIIIVIEIALNHQKISPFVMDQLKESFTTNGAIHVPRKGDLEIDRRCIWIRRWRWRRRRWRRYRRRFNRAASMQKTDKLCPITEFSVGAIESSIETLRHKGSNDLIIPSVKPIYVTSHPIR